ncbi:hypothetical protein DUNSADRAFT_2575 [Dunaliella salina]|uniref:Uncharacterized protein n=1 Tax=Dunaliella salina TaxID=3046 RepID=A0ABQ7GVE5_DUNSA|nr:hypothetical protein DUNSADRAFT_2575 [Dunaliella salina]|eukprot:KAF5838591.1 hypothetical protein DUNSADRAFT_2575 [Dunaliella salina]
MRQQCTNTQADPAWIVQQQEAGSSAQSDASEEPLSPLTPDAQSQNADDEKQQHWQQQQEHLLVQQLHQQEQEQQLQQQEQEQQQKLEQQQQQQQQHTSNSTKPSRGLLSGFSKLVSSKAPSSTSGRSRAPASTNGSSVRSMGAALKATLGGMMLPQRQKQQQQQQQAKLAGPEECGSMGMMVMGLEGSWLSHLNAGGERLWTWATEVCERFSPIETPLPSDSRFRQDLVALHEGDMAEAGRWKVLLEQQQRADKALREAGRGGS